MATKSEQEALWTEAQRRCRLSKEELRMAREIGLNPRSLIKNIPNKSEPWKAPVKDWVRDLYRKRQDKHKGRARTHDGQSDHDGETIRSMPSGQNSPMRDSGRIIAESEVDELRAKVRIELADHVENEDELDEIVESHPPDEPIAFFGDHLPPTRKEVEEENDRMLRRHRQFRLTARFVAEALSSVPAVQKVVLFGSVARESWKEVPRFRKFRRARVAIWHECKDVDLAVWPNDLQALKSLQQALKQGLNRLREQHAISLAPHQIEIFILDPGTNRYLGRVCAFNACPKGRFKRECLVPGCGKPLFLQQHEGFKFYRDALAADNILLLFDRHEMKPDPVQNG